MRDSSTPIRGDVTLQPSSAFPTGVSSLFHPSDSATPDLSVFLPQISQSPSLPLSSTNDVGMTSSYVHGSYMQTTSFPLAPTIENGDFSSSLSENEIFSSSPSNLFSSSFTAKLSFPSLHPSNSDTKNVNVFFNCNHNHLAICYILKIRKSHQ